jgi:hypothetical protein
MSDVTLLPASEMTSRTQSQLGQLVLCRGCCCGQTARGLPAVPVERIKAIWKAEKLNRSIQLSISGCLGPCDLPNVALVLTPRETIWFGNLSGDDDYDQLIDWARGCHSANLLLSLPETLMEKRLRRFSTADSSL